MKLTCEGCGAVVEGENADAVHAAMMAHGDEAHWNHFDGKSPDEMRQMRQMIADQN